MKMKRYFAADARTALRELRDDQGPDAVILSNRKVDGGVEIIAALDYEDALDNSALGSPYMGDTRTEHNTNSQPVSHISTEEELQAVASYQHQASSDNDKSTLARIREELKGLRSIMEAPLMQFAWGEMSRIQPLHANLLKQLMTLGLSASLSEAIAKKIAEQGLNKHSWLEALKLLSALIPVAEEDVLKQGGVVSLVGPTGVGKTTTIAKIAAKFALKHGRRNVSLITTDSYRIGAHEQLRTYGRILGVPVQVATDAEELENILSHISRNDDTPHLTLIDTAGIGQTDIRLAEHLSTLKLNDIAIKNYLVMSATGQISLQDDVVSAFSQAGLHGCILTKVDETASLGEALSVLIQHNLPVAYMCDGQKVPDDFHHARGKALVKAAVKLMQKTRAIPSKEQLAYNYGGVVTHAGV